jgi:hypothetical protein
LRFFDFYWILQNCIFVITSVSLLFHFTNLNNHFFHNVFFFFNNRYIEIQAHYRHKNGNVSSLQ